MSDPRRLVLFVALLFLGFPSAAQTIGKGKQPPQGELAPSPLGRNVLILLADDLGVEQLAVYGIGQDFPQTPRIDELAANGVLFRNAWSSPNCSPTRAGLMTGRHGFRTGVGHVIFTWTEALPPSEVTLAEVLDKGPADYATGMFGKWHLGSFANGAYLSANQAGWDLFDGSMLGFAGVQSYYDWQRCINGVVATCTQYATSVQVDAALEWLETAPEPWICYVPFMGVHTPFEAPPAGLYYENLGQSPSTRQLYKAMVEALDTEIGRLLDGVEQLDCAPPLIVFAADNGTVDEVVVPPVKPGKAKGTLYQGGIHVPLIVSGWDPIPPGSQCDALVQMLDVFETATDFGGLDVRAELPGVTLDSRSLRPLLANPAGPEIHDTIYSEIFWPVGLGTPWWHDKAIRDQRYKLMVTNDVESLYDLELDPNEKTNLLLSSLSAEHLAAYNKLQQELALLLQSD